jgi:aconitate hydratase
MKPGTVARNFPGRIGTREDSVYLRSPETAGAFMLTGVAINRRDVGTDGPADR